MALVPNPSLFVISLISRFKRLASNLLPKDGFGRQVAIMGGGTAVVQAVGVLAAPLLTRLYEPADFGVMAAFQAITGIVVLGATLRFAAAIPIVTDDREAAKLLAVSCVCVLIVSAIVLVLVVVLPESVFLLLSDDERFFRYRWFLVVAVAGGAIHLSLTGWVTRKHHFVLLSASRAYQSLSSVGIQLGAGAFGAGVVGLIAGAVTNMTNGIWMLLKRTVRDLRIIGFSGLHQGLANVAWSHRKFPSFTLGTSLLDLMGRSAPTIVISALYGSTATGFYGVGLRVIGIPSALISASVANVFLSRVAEATKSGALGALMESVTARLSGLSAYLFCVLFGFGPELFRFVFGAEWGDAGLYVRFLAPWLFLKFVFSPQTSVVLARNRQGTQVIWQIPIVGLRLLALYVGNRLGGVNDAIALFGCTSAVTAAGYFTWALRVGGASLRRVGARLALDLLPVAVLTGGARILFEISGQSIVVMVSVIGLIGIILSPRLVAAWRGNGV